MSFCSSSDSVTYLRGKAKGRLTFTQFDDDEGAVPSAHRSGSKRCKLIDALTSFMAPSTPAASLLLHQVNNPEDFAWRVTAVGPNESGNANDAYEQTVDSSASGRARAASTSSSAASPRSVETNAPCGRFGHTAVLYERGMYIFGGKTSDRYLNDVHCYCLKKSAWRALPQQPPHSALPCPRGGHTAVVYGNRMYVIAGAYSNVCIGADDMWSYDLDNHVWTKELEGLPFTPCKGHTTHLLLATNTAERSSSDMLVNFGGLTCPSAAQRQALPPGHVTVSYATSDVYLYNLRTKHWSQLRTTGDAPAPRSFHVSGIIEGTAMMVVFGGRTIVHRSALASVNDPGSAASQEGAADVATESAFANDLRILDISTGVWREVKVSHGNLPDPRMCSAGVFANGVFAVFAGGGNVLSNEGFEYRHAIGQWRRFTITGEPRCSRPTVIYAGDRLVFFGGCQGSNTFVSDVFELQLPTLSLRNQCAMWLRRNTIAATMVATTRMRRCGRGDECAFSLCGGAASPGSSSPASPSTRSWHGLLSPAVQPALGRQCLPHRGTVTSPMSAIFSDTTPGMSERHMSPTELPTSTASQFDPCSNITDVVVLQPPSSMNSSCVPGRLLLHHYGSAVNSDRSLYRSPVSQTGHSSSRSNQRHTLFPIASRNASGYLSPASAGQRWDSPLSVGEPLMPRAESEIVVSHRVATNSGQQTYRRFPSQPRQHGGPISPELRPCGPLHHHHNHHLGLTNFIARASPHPPGGGMTLAAAGRPASGGAATSVEDVAQNLFTSLESSSGPYVIEQVLGNLREQPMRN